VKYHDIHHWYPDANFGQVSVELAATMSRRAPQYTMFWDHVFRSFKAYPTFKNTDVNTLNTNEELKVKVGGDQCERSATVYFVCRCLIMMMMI
jgi:hypothetical protein